MKEHTRLKFTDKEILMYRKCYKDKKIIPMYCKMIQRQKNNPYLSEMLKRKKKMLKRKKENPYVSEMLKRHTQKTSCM